MRIRLARGDAVGGDLVLALADGVALDAIDNGLLAAFLDKLGYGEAVVVFGEELFAVLQQKLEAL